MAVGASLRALVSAAVAAVIIAGTETVAGYPRPTFASSSFFGFAAITYFPFLLVAGGLLSRVFPERGLDLWLPVLAGLVRAVGILGPEIEAGPDAGSLAAGMLTALAIVIAAFKVAKLVKAAPPFLFGSTVGMVLPILMARVSTESLVSRLGTTARASATGALAGVLAFVVLRGLVSRWPKTAPVFILGPIVSLGLWSQPASDPAAGATPPLGRTPRPDIVLIVLDTVRAPSLASYGYARNTMPGLEAFAREATTFERVWTNGSWTLPGHISLFSGLALARHRYDSGFAAAERASPDSFIAARLRAGGYATAAVAANFGVLGREEPALFGFDHTEVEPLRPFASKPWLFDLAARFPRAPWLRQQAAAFPAPTMRGPWVVDRGLSWWAGERGGPRFLFVNFMDAHLPWIPAPQDLGRFGPIALDVESEQLSVLGRYRSGGRPTAAEVVILGNRYDEALSSLDRSVARLIQGVGEGSRGNQPIVVVTSDHGESLGEHDRFGHRNSLDEAATRIPLIVRGPGLSPGLRRDEPVQLTDVFGYLARSAGIETEPGLDSLPFGERRAVVIEHRPGPQGALPSSYPRGDLSALVEWPFKYIEGPSTEAALFDLATDSNEETNLAAAEPARAEAMRSRLRVLSAVPSSRGAQTRDRAAEERLRALGYAR